MTKKIDDMTIAQLQDYIESKKKEKEDLEEKATMTKKKKGNFSKKIVLLVIFLNIIFTLTILYLFERTGNEPMALVGAWFGFTGIELWSLASIKKKKEENING